MHKIFIFSNLLLLFSISLNATELKIVPVGEAQADTLKYSISILKDNNASLKTIKNILVNDFSFYRSIIERNQSSSKSDLLINIKRENKFVFIETTFNEKKITNKVNLKFNRKDIHKVADNIYNLITNKKSIFNSSIIFVSDRTSKKRKIVKELYIMDFDGFNKKRLTFFNKTVVSPAFSPDNKLISFSLIEGYGKSKNINLYTLNLQNKKFKKISTYKGMNSGAIFSPDGKELVLTLSINGNAEIYKINIKSKKLIRLTKNYAPDVDPSVFGNKLTFLSGRPGKPMIYVSDFDGLEKNVKRISYVGKFNATPRFSPSGETIVFSSWLDNRFDLFRINSNGTGLSRLTKDFGSNEDPNYTNDGQFIVFSSQKVYSRSKAVTNLYIMDNEGQIISKLTNNYGNCQSSRASN